MSKRKVINRSQIGARLPIGGTVTLWLLIDRFKELPGWVIGMSWTLWSIFWIFAIIAVCTQEPVDVDIEKIEV